MNSGDHSASPEEDQIHVALADLPVAAAVLDIRGRLICFNDAARELMRLTSSLRGRMAFMATQAAGSVETLKQGYHPLRLTVVRERKPQLPGLRIVFIEAEPTTPAQAGLDPFLQLTPRQNDVAALAATGLRTAEIALQVGCGERTIRAHLQEIYRRLKVRSRTELAVLHAHHHG